MLEGRKSAYSYPLMQYFIWKLIDFIRTQLLRHIDPTRPGHQNVLLFNRYSGTGYLVENS